MGKRRAGIHYAAGKTTVIPRASACSRCRLAGRVLWRMSFVAPLLGTGSGRRAILDCLDLSWPCPDDANHAIADANMYAADLRAHGYNAEAVEAVRQTALAQKASSVISNSQGADFPGWGLLRGSRIGLRLAELAAVLLVLWELAASVLLHVPAMRSNSPIARPVAWGIGIAVVVGTALSFAGPFFVLRDPSYRQAGLFRSTLNGCLILLSLLTVASGTFVAQRRGAVSSFAFALFAALFVSCALLTFSIWEAPMLAPRQYQVGIDGPRALARIAGVAWPVR
jgi:hypothetical protein